MVKVNLKDGRTLAFDLGATGDERRWKAAASVADFQRTITGMALLHGGELHALPLPKSFHSVSWSADALRDRENAIVGERISVQADDTLATITLYFRETPKLTRFDLRRIGRPRFVSRGRAMPTGHQPDNED